MKSNQIKLSLDSISSESIELFKASSVGIEKECLRTVNEKLSESLHPTELGSSLTNRYITTDFSESQLELITPPMTNNKDALQFLKDIHHFVYRNLNDEILWPFSMPPYISSDTEIPLAEYGKSNLGLFKKTYRNGLSNRYGRMMQAISGIHYNFSFSDSLWTGLCKHNNVNELEEIRSAAYLKLLRNASRLNWLIIYLFGSSPLIMGEPSQEDKKDFLKIDDYTYFLPYATSLRMSDYGYTNTKISKLNVSLNSLDEYIKDLRLATLKKDPDLTELINQEESILSQLNHNILQIENEYYAVARVKSSLSNYMRETSKLQFGGIDFIELRSIDLNPFAPCGIDDDTAIFLEIFCIYCILADEDLLFNLEFNNIKLNDSLVSKQGRIEGLKLINNNKEVLLADWGNEIFDQISNIAELIEDEKKEYSDAINRLRLRIEDSTLTPSSRILEKVSAEKTSYHDLAISIGKENKIQFLSISPEINNNWGILSEEANLSVELTKKIELETEITFDEFLRQYENESID